VEQCQICQTKFHVLSEYHLETHGLTKEEYREKYGKKIVKGISLGKVHRSEIELYEQEKTRRMV
jgi:hypothetical protein